MATQDLYSTFFPMGIISDLFDLQFSYEVFLYLNNYSHHSSAKLLGFVRQIKLL